MKMQKLILMMMTITEGSNDHKFVLNVLTNYQATKEINQPNSPVGAKQQARMLGHSITDT